ncbi:MAG: bifunctional DNA-formamidopyrimidine glycosylase/DNA-(apurinic or apyrimidinic site) lyase [bacterium]|nr:bifunctional DNA-formamidopyrimidine glycosylase/DNA-(apurinic or apyrimidinic site) lyase [bacterium]
MPELPEVETIRRGLAPQIVGRQITAVRVRQPQLRERVDVKALQEQVVGCTIDTVDRRAKYILVRLQPALVLVLHLGMTGRLRVGQPAAVDATHDHLIFQLGPDLELRFNDPRRFGMCFLTPAATLSEHPRFRHLGPEPLSDDFSEAYLQGRARGRRVPVKNFLMDASIVVGVGNIYASESLFLARIRPTREVGRLRRLHWQRIYTAVQHVLREAIEHHGTTFSDYVDSEGRRGEFQNRLLVYGREGETCCRDGRRIRRMVQAGRSSFYCPGCQR